MDYQAQFFLLLRHTVDKWSCRTLGGVRFLSFSFRGQNRYESLMSYMNLLWTYRNKSHCHGVNGSNLLLEFEIYSDPGRNAGAVVYYGEESLEVLELEVLRSITYVISSFFL